MRFVYRMKHNNSPAHPPHNDQSIAKKSDSHRLISPPKQMYFALHLCAIEPHKRAMPRLLGIPLGAIVKLSENHSQLLMRESNFRA